MAERLETYVLNDLDIVDRRILSELQRNGRIANSDLAARVGLSPPPCSRRVRSLTTKGYVRRVRALLDEKLLGFAVTSFVEVRLRSQRDGQLACFEETIRSISHVLECWRVLGGSDYVLKCIAASIAEFQSQIAYFASLPNVQNVKSSVTLWSAKDVGVPLEVYQRPASRFTSAVSRLGTEARS
jgi:DNA-binding Lrp family transcriptional regulator